MASPNHFCEPHATGSLSVLKGKNSYSHSYSTGHWGGRSSRQHSSSRC